jgi:hypothetical protein
MSTMARRMKFSWKKRKTSMQLRRKKRSLKRIRSKWIIICSSTLNCF